MPIISLWTDLAGRAGITLADDQHQRLSRYLDLLEQGNARMNLTRITERATAEVQHVGDALTVLPFLPRDTHLLADLGSGAGVPGIPLAIARPDARVLLIEATTKKATFLRETVTALELTNVTVIPQRAEDAGRSEHRENCDVVVCRAVATMPWLIEWSIPLLKKGGRMLAMKGPKLVEELPQATNALRQLHAAAPVIHPVDLPGTDGHVIVEIAKTGRTDPRYPRPPSSAKARPVE